MTDFSGKIALVTGAASGIGLAIAKRFLADGATVVGTDFNAETLGAVASELGDSFVPIVSDAGKVVDIKSVVDTVREKFGGLDYLVNNAGIGVLKTPETVTEEEYDACVNVLIKGPTFFIKYAADLLRASDDGVVINMSSASAIITMPTYTPYAQAKEAICKLTRDCVVTVPGVRHNAILPGVIVTPILDLAYGEQKDTLLAGAGALNPLKRNGVPDDIANAVAFLCSPQAAYINGVCLPVDGGIHNVSCLAAETVLNS